VDGTAGAKTVIVLPCHFTAGPLVKPPTTVPLLLMA